VRTTNNGWSFNSEHRSVDLLSAMVITNIFDIEACGWDKRFETCISECGALDKNIAYPYGQLIKIWNLFLFG